MPNVDERHENVILSSAFSATLISCGQEFSQSRFYFFVSLMNLLPVIALPSLREDETLVITRYLPHCEMCSGFEVPCWSLTTVPVCVCVLLSDDPENNRRVLDDTVVLHSATQQDTAVYQCEASNSHGSILANLNIMVMSGCRSNSSASFRHDAAVRNIVESA